jgi:hypothetical protein
MRYERPDIYLGRALDHFFQIKVVQAHFSTRSDFIKQILHNGELHNLYSSPDIIRQIKSRRVRWAGHVARMGGEKTVRVLVGKPEGKRPSERRRRRWEDGIKMGLGEIGLGGWSGFSWLRIGIVEGLL